MAETYGTNVIPSDQITVRSGGTVAISVAFETTLGLVGGMDTANGDATPGNVQTIASVPEAETAFGADSELAKAIQTAYNQNSPPSEIYAVGVSETTGVTDTFAGTQSGTLDNAPAFDPNLHDEHTITAQDTVEGASVDVNIVYESAPSNPTDANTINLNPVTGEWAADESSDYDITYDYGDYSTAITALADKAPRFLSVLTENTSVANDLLSTLNNNASDFEFTHGVVGALPEVTPADYSDTFDARRLSVVAPSRAFTDAANTEMVRTMGAVGGKQSGKALGDSTTYESLGGFADLNTKYTNSELGTLIDAEVLPLKQGGGIRIIKDMTTSQDVKFERIYASEIVDEATEISHRISQQFIGEVNTDENRTALAASHRSSYASMASDDLLDNFAVSVSKGANDFEVDVKIGLDVVGIMDTIDVTITVGDVITNGGAA